VVGTEHLEVGHCIRHSFDHERAPSHNRQSRTSHLRTSSLGQLHPLMTGLDYSHEAVHVFSKAKTIMLQPELFREFVSCLLLPVHFLYALLHHFFIPGLQC
jgi:hypothetical protein